MRVLLVNNHHQMLGGTERHYFELSKLLTANGHEVAHFSTKSADNESSIWENYFIDKINFNNSGVINMFRILTRMFYSLDSRRKIAHLLDDFKPDVVHIHNIYYYISPSILSEIKRRGIPIVQTLHDYQLITPSITFFHDGNICEITKKHAYHRAVLHKCVKCSYFASLLAVVASYTQRYFKLYERRVDRFVAPSQFLKAKFVEYGFDAKKITIIPHFVHASKPLSNNGRSYVLFFGRLLEYKGIYCILEAAKRLPHIPFIVAGDGPEKNRVVARAKKLKNLRFCGPLDMKTLRRVISASAFCLVPSLWYENLPYSILESFSLGKTVVASNIGGIPEIVISAKTGFLVEPGNIDRFSETISWLWKNPKIAKKIGMAAQKYATLRYDEQIYYRALLSLYKEIIHH